ncbi:MAG: hypothetical protein ACRC5C_02925 [Bacilli bacterium]
MRKKHLISSSIALLLSVPCFALQMPTLAKGHVLGETNPYAENDELQAIFQMYENFNDAQSHTDGQHLVISPNPLTDVTRVKAVTTTWNKKSIRLFELPDTKQIQRTLLIRNKAYIDAFKKNKITKLHYNITLNTKGLVSVRFLVTRPTGNTFVTEIETLLLNVKKDRIEQHFGLDKSTFKEPIVQSLFTQKVGSANAIDANTPMTISLGSRSLDYTFYVKHSGTGEGYRQIVIHDDELKDALKFYFKKSRNTDDSI